MNEYTIQNYTSKEQTNEKCNAMKGIQVEKSIK